MNVKCLIGMHKWNGCRCEGCGKTKVPDELNVILISRNGDNNLLQVDFEQRKGVALAWRSSGSAMAWVKDGGIVAKADEQPGSNAYKVSFFLPDGTRMPIGEIRYFAFSPIKLKQMISVVCLDPAPGSVKGTFVSL